MHVRSRTLSAAVLAAAVAAALAGCTPSSGPRADPTSSADAPATTTAPSAEATATATPTAGPSERPAPSAADATGLLIGPTSFTLVDASGADLGTWDYRNGTGAVEALTEAFGSAPTESDDIPYEGYRSRASSWPGFVFKDTKVYDAGGPEPKYPEPDFLLDVSAPVVGDVAVTTLSGVAVGDAALDVRDQHPDATTGDSLRFLLLDRTTIGTLDGSDLVYGVGVVAEDETTITSIRVPSVNWGV